MSIKENLNKKTFGLIGRDIAYSFSPQYFTEKFERMNIGAEYKLFDLQDIKEVSSLLLNKDISGLNVTIPYKEDVIKYLDDLSIEAKEIGAVNTIKFDQGKRIGHNTDHIGFKKSILPLLKPHHNQALILGSGGATKAIQYALNQLNISFSIVSRDSTKGDFTYDELDKMIIEAYPIIINATPIGTFPDNHKKPGIPYKFLNKGHLAYDLIYNPELTQFLKCASKQNSITKNGLEMLKLQAEASWKIWNE